eukprot:scaffold31372_cov78-Phaeocystis_antarctica.AAC.1
MRSEAAAVAEAAAAHAPRPQSKHSLLTSFYYYSRWLPSWRALRRGARLLLRQRAAAHAPQPLK